MKKIILLKLGGSVITDKAGKSVIREEVLHDLVSQLAQFMAENPDILLFVGHGQGSFAHVPAKKYNTKLGFISTESKFGMAVTQHRVGEAHQLVLQEMLEQKLPAVSFRINSSLVTDSSGTKVWQGAVLVEYLKQGLLPITTGDVVVDSAQGCAIWSTEKILEQVCGFLPEHGFEVERIVHVTDVPGVTDLGGETIKEISPENAASVRKMITSPSVADVTGGMWHKIETSLNLAQKGVDSQIISGLEPKNMYNCLSRQQYIGTKITRTK